MADETTVTGLSSDSQPRYQLSPMLEALADILSKWYIIMRSAIKRERDRQDQFRQDNHLKRSVKLEYIPPVLSDGDNEVALSCEQRLRDMLGCNIAWYAKSRFLKGISTGDMRSFKLRLILLKAQITVKYQEKAQDLLDPDKLQECITLAESLAGCKPYAGARRLSKAEQMRAKVRVYLCNGTDNRPNKRGRRPSICVGWDTIAKQDSDKIAEVIRDFAPDGMIEHIKMDIEDPAEPKEPKIERAVQDPVEQSDAKSDGNADVTNDDGNHRLPLSIRIAAAADCDVTGEPVDNDDDDEESMRDDVLDIASYRRSSYFGGYSHNGSEWCPEDAM